MKVLLFIFIFLILSTKAFADYSDYSVWDNDEVSIQDRIDYEQSKYDKRLALKNL